MGLEISSFISPHGFGHATRTIAVLEALHARHPDLVVNLITSVPQTLFHSVSFDYRYHLYETDVGIQQKDGFHLDLGATAAALKRFTSFEPGAKRLRSICSTSKLIHTDISILGIHIAKQLTIPSVLVENFTWDWIYTKLDEEISFSPLIGQFERLYQQVDVHIQTEPICFRKKSSFRCQPIARSLSSTPSLFREILDLDDRPLVLITTGGIHTELPFIDQLKQASDFTFVLTGQNHSVKLCTNIYALSADNELHHPDLVAGADLVVCKSGYSTLAECCQSTAAVVCVSRPAFPESAVLEQFVCENLKGAVISQDMFLSGRWLAELKRLIQPRDGVYNTDGAQQAADIIISVLNS